MMTRTLIFDGERGGERFGLLRLAVFSAGDGKGDRARATIRKEARILDALDSISEAAPLKDDPDYRLLTTSRGDRVTLSQEDFELVERYVDTAAWTPRSARAAVDLQDWLSATKVDP